MKKAPLSLFLFLALASLLFLPHLLPTVRLWVFAPFIILSFYRSSWIQSLWLSFACGLFLDISSSQWPFGLFASLHLATTSVIYRQKKNFFDENPVAFCFFTALFSCVQSCFFLIASHLTGVPLSGSFLFYCSVLFLHPFLDAIYAGIGYTLFLGARRVYRHFLQKKYAAREAL